MLSSSALLVAAALAVGQAGESTSNFEHLKSLDFLTGTWAESPPKSDFLVCEWVLGKNMLLLTGVFDRSGHNREWGVKGMVFWDAAAKRMEWYLALADGYVRGTVVVNGGQTIFLLVKLEELDLKGGGSYGYLVKKKGDDNLIVVTGFWDGVSFETGSFPFEFTKDFKKVKSPAVDPTVIFERVGEDRFSHGPFKPLNGLNGNWTTSFTPPGEDKPSERFVANEWILNKRVQFVTITDERESALAMQMRVPLYYPHASSITVSSDGSYAQGRIRFEGDKVIVRNEGVTASGKKTSGTIIYTKKTDDLFVVEYKDNVVEGERQEDWSADLTRVK